jgi:5-hydroxyisourate hydrolase
LDTDPDTYPTPYGPAYNVARRDRKPARRHDTMGRLTTHVLDTAHGTPAAGVAITLLRREGERHVRLLATATNADGRCDAPLLEGDALVAGRYRIVFAAGDYFRRRDVALPDPPFVDEVVIDFGIADANAHYHVPLLMSPWAWSTYRGS